MSNNRTEQTKNYLLILSLSILFYLPYLLHTFYNNDTLNRVILPFSLNPLPDMLFYLKAEYKPLYGFFMFNYLPYKIGIPSQILVLLGVIFFSIALHGFVNFFVPTLSKLSKLFIYLLAFCNPYVFLESGWWGQFMGQGLVSCLYLVSFILIDRYKTKPNNLKKIALAYGVPIFSVVFGLNFFMPSFFHFIVLAFLYVVKNHLENPFKNIKDFFIFSLPVLVVIALSSIIYAVEIKSLLALLNVNISDGRAENYDMLSSFSELKSRLVKLSQSYPKAYNLLAIINTGILFLLIKRNRLSIIFIVLTLLIMLISYIFLIMLISYIFLIMLNIHSTEILSFVNYYLFVFLFAFVLLYIKNRHIETMLKIASLGLIVFFYFSSYFWAMWGLRHEKIMKTELAKLEQVAYSQYKKELPIFILGGVNNWNNQLMKPHFLINKFFSLKGYGLRVALPWRFNGTNYNFENIKGNATNDKNLLKQNKQANILRKQGKIYPKEGSMFLYNKTIYVVGDVYSK